MRDQAHGYGYAVRGYGCAGPYTGARHAIRGPMDACVARDTTHRRTRRAGQCDAHRAHTSAVLSFENVGVPGVLYIIPKFPEKFKKIYFPGISRDFSLKGPVYG
jgi:hypothetical protein